MSLYGTNKVSVFIALQFYHVPLNGPRIRGWQLFHVDTELSMPCLSPCGGEILPKTFQNLDVCHGHERNNAIPNIPQPFEVGYRKVTFLCGLSATFCGTGIRPANPWERHQGLWCVALRLRLLMTCVLHFPRPLAVSHITAGPR